MLGRIRRSELDILTESDEEVLNKLKVLNKRFNGNIMNNQNGIQCGERLHSVRKIKKGIICYRMISDQFSFILSLESVY